MRNDKPDVHTTPATSPAAPGTHTPRARRRRRDPAGQTAVEVGGPKGLEPTRYGDWERKGRCIDF